VDEKTLLLNSQLLLDKLLVLRKDVYQEGMEIFQKWYPLITRKSFLFSALNLAFYLALRRRDIRELQLALKPLGLSSLGRSEASAIANLDAVIASLSRVCGKGAEEGVTYPSIRKFFRGDWALIRQTKIVFGKSPQNRNVRIMVTLPTEAAVDYELVKNLLQNGMNVIRINCAHDDQETWEAMIANLRKAEKKLGVHCKILMDLAGTKIRIEKLMIFGEDAKVSIGSLVLLTKGDFNTQQPVEVAVSCNKPEILGALVIGDAVYIDDGRIEAIVETVLPEGVTIRVLTTKGARPVRLKPHKGLNFPSTRVTLPPITEKDRKDLDYIVTVADAIGYSFVKSASDIIELQHELEQRLGTKMNKLVLVAKIETDDGVNNLPEIIVRAASKQPFAVMIARGDLAVEVGYTRLAELQEEILWICEAAHVPVIWATQVLESLVRFGIPSRAEITDAAMSERAECVMLNKGPFVVEAVDILNDILKRMGSHQYKKSPQLRALNIAKRQE